MPARVPRQARSRAKFHMILQAALDLFRERGYTETTVEAIVERSGVSVGVFYSYFASKQQLLLTLFELETAPDDGSIFSLPEQLLTVDELEAMIWRFLRQSGSLQQVRQELLHINPDFAQNERAIQQNKHERLTRDLERLRASGLIRQDIRYATCAWVLLAIFSRLSDMLNEQSEQEIAEEVHASSLLIYHMLHTDSPQG